MQKGLLFLLLALLPVYLTAQGVEGDDCESAIDLAGLTAPYQGSTLFARNDFDLCSMGSSGDLIFYYDVEPGAEIEIWQPSNEFDSRHTMRWGGACPGENIVDCVDDPDTKPLIWFNTTSESQRVWFVIGGYGSGAGSFLLDWHYKAPDSCFEPVIVGVFAITTETAMVKWTNRSNSFEWELVYGPWGFDLPTQGERMVVKEPSVRLSGLTHTSAYQIYVRTLCGEDAASEWVSTSFFTACVSMSIPYQPDLSNVDALHCWNFSSSSWAGSQYVHSSSIHYDLINTSIIHVMPLVDEPLADLSVRFFASTSSFTDAGSDKLLEIGTLSNPSDMATFVAAESFVLSALSGNRTSYGAVLQNVPVGHTYIGWRLVNEESDYLSFQVSDVVVDYADACVSPVELQAESLAARYATFTWRELGTSEIWDLVIGAVGFDPDESGVMLEAEANGLMVEGLTPGTFYDVYVRSKCSEVSGWSGPLKIITPVACAAPFNAAAESVSETSILVNWDSSFGVNDWEIEFSEWGHVKETPAIVSVSGEQSYLVENLKPNTYYTFRIRSSCGDEDGFSFWSGNASATGLCQGLAAIPYENDFDGVPDGMMPICWESILQAGQHGYMGAWYYDYDNGFLGLQTDGRMMALLPELDADLQDLRIGFKAMNPSWSGVSLILEVVVLTKDNVVEVIQSINMEYTNSGIWSEYVVYLENYIGSAGRLGIRLSSESVYSYPNLFLDELIVDYIPACPEPYGLAIEDLTQNEAHISWSQYGAAESLALLWGPEGFDIETEGELLTLDGGVTEHIFSSLEPSTAYEVYVRNNCSAENQSVWSRPLKMVTPCWPLEVALLNIAENEVLNPADGLTFNLSYHFDCSKSLSIGLENMSTRTFYWLTNSELAAAEGAVEMDLPLTIPSGNYRVVVFYRNYNNRGLLADFTANSHLFVIQNNTRWLEISTPSERTVFMFRPHYSNYLWLAWNSVGLSSVNIDFSKDNGTTWENWVSNWNSSNGYSPYGYNSYYGSIAYNWVGESMLFRIASSSNAEMFVVTPEVVILDWHPFTLISPIVQTEVPHGTNFEIEFDMLISDRVRYSLFDMDGGPSIASGEVEVIKGENLISVPTNDLDIGRSYFIEIYGSGWSFWDVSQFTVTLLTSMEVNTMDGKDVVIYPVPTNHLLHIKVKSLPFNTTATLFDLSGRKLIESSLNGTPLNLSHLASGVYLLIIDGKSYKVVKR